MRSTRDRRESLASPTGLRVEGIGLRVEGFKHPKP